MKKYFLPFILTIVLDTRIICSDFFEQYHIVLSDNGSKKVIGAIFFVFMFLFVTIKLYQVIVQSKKILLIDNVLSVFFTPFIIAYLFLSIVFIIRDSGFGMINLILGPVAIILYFVLNILLWYLLFRKNRLGK